VRTNTPANHAAALARAAQLRGIPATIVMPSNAPAVKVRNVESFGAKVVKCEPTQQAREAAADRIVRETGAVLVHPFTNYEVMAGQGTAAVELLDEAPGLDVVVCPVGGGGLLSGTAVAVKALRPQAKVIAAEPAGAADAAESFRAGKIVPAAKVETIADGLRTTIGEENFAIMRAHVDDVVTVGEAEIVTAMRELWEALHVVVEPSGAVPFAAIRAGKIAVRGKQVGIILSGGNVDLDALPWIKR
jgi:threonine dehydratase